MEIGERLVERPAVVARQDLGERALGRALAHRRGELEDGSQEVAQDRVVGVHGRDCARSFVAVGLEVGGAREGGGGDLALRPGGEGRLA